MTRIFTALLAAMLCALAAATASADGMYSVKDAPAPCCEANWSGLYIGASVGYGIARSSTTYQVDQSEFDADPNVQIPGTFFFGDTSADTASDGVTGTVTVGYDRDIGRSVVIGVFADYTFGDLDGEFDSRFQQNNNLRFGADHDFTFSDQWSVGARIGLARSCCTLWYIAAGYTQADFEADDNRIRDTLGGEVSLGTRGKTLDGYFIGAGVEQQLHSGLSLKLEYRFSDFGEESIYDVNQQFQCTNNCTGENYKRRERLDIDGDIHAIRLGLAYKFDLHRPAPVEPLK